MSKRHMSTDDKIELAYEEALAMVRYTFEQIAARCESPIEKLLLLQFAASAHGTETFEENGHEYKALTFGHDHHGTVRFIPQYRVSLDGAEYRIDIAFVDGINKVAIECDGHDWHERTKEQASRDKSRERALATAGWIVLRFTGSDIWRDPRECAREVVKAIMASKERLEVKAK